MKTIYVIDACALIDAAKHYKMSKATFSPIWDAIDEMIEKGELITSSEIHDELKDDDLIEWAKKHKEMFIPLTQEIQIRAKEILKISYAYKNEKHVQFKWRSFFNSHSY